MECEWKLSVDNISALVGFLEIARFNRPFSPDGILPKEEIHGSLSLSETLNEFQPQVKVFGDTYEGVYRNGKQHVRDCGSCNEHYRELISGVVGLMNGSDRTVPTDAEFFEEDRRDLDGTWLNILYKDN